MLDEQSYITAIYVYLGSAGVFLLYLAWWLGRHWNASWTTLAVLLMAALLLTPAYPKADADTMAPALIVAIFQITTMGVEEARDAWRPLIFMAGLAIVLTLFLRITIFRRRKPRKARKTVPPRKASA